MLRSDPAPPLMEGGRQARLPSTSFPLPLLTIGATRAVLLQGVVDAPAARLAAAQTALRDLTGDTALTISLRPSGRPRLDPPYPELGVSLSHRGEFVLAGVSPEAPAGVDIELDAPDLDAARLAADHFTPAEAAAIHALPVAAARDTFLRLWVAKEASLKVTGRGIYDGLAEPDLSSHVAALGEDGAAVVLPRSANLPPMRLAVCRLDLPARPAIYCGLAVEAQ